MIAFRQTSLALTALFIAGAQAASAQNPAAAALPGYTAANSAAQLQLEAATRDRLSADRARTMVRAFSKEPHVAGTPAQARTRDLFAQYLKDAGVSAHIDMYQIYMPHPTSVRLFRVAPDSVELTTDEGVIDEDSSTMSSSRVPAYNGYGAAGDVSGEVVFVNYGLIEDYKMLDSLGVSVAGKIAVARYGKSYRGIKAREAEKHGAAGLIIYSDPAEDGYMRGDIYPEGPMRPHQGVQRGSVYNDNGDPTTPDYPSLPGAKRIPLEQTTLPRIPVIPTSYDNAMQLLEGVRGHPIPAGWQGGLPFRYHVGPGPVRARITVATDAMTTPYKNIWNVLGTIKGSEFPDEVILIGGHRDAWGPGAADNVSGTVTVLETARAVAEMVKQGFKPKRTIVFASWDAEEWGLMGSTEYVEQERDRLTKNGVAYFNQDMVAFGPAFSATGSPSLRPMLRDVTSRIPDPSGAGSIYDVWLHGTRAVTDSTTPDIGDPGGGSDFAGFYNHLGIPIIEWGFGGGQGIYHSAYDSFHWVSKFGDPTFTHHVAAAAVGTAAVLRLANADVLPYDYVEYARAMRVLADSAAKHIADRGWTGVSTAELKAAIGRMEQAATEYAAARDAALASATETVPVETRKRVDEQLLAVERVFTRPAGLVGREWFRNVIYAADDDNGYDNITLPTINEAVRANDQARTVQEIADLEQRFESAATLLAQTAQSLR